MKTFMGLLVTVFLLLAWWFDHRGFLHGMAVVAQVWWLWSIRPWPMRSAGRRVKA